MHVELQTPSSCSVVVMGTRIRLIDSYSVVEDPRADTVDAGLVNLRDGLQLPDWLAISSPVMHEHTKDVNYTGGLLVAPRHLVIPPVPHESSRAQIQPL